MCNVFKQNVLCMLGGRARYGNDKEKHQQFKWEKHIAIYENQHDEQKNEPK